MVIRRTYAILLAASTLALGFGSCTTSSGASSAPPSTRHTPAPGFVQNNQEEYRSWEESHFLDPREQPLSTFAIDVDTASYAIARRFLHDDMLPPADSVRVEEYLNYFDYDYPQAVDGHPLSVSLEMGVCPWEPDHDLLAIGLQGQVYETKEVPPSNLVFLIDVSGSMNSNDKLPLLVRSMQLLTDRLRSQDRVAIVTYSGRAEVVLEPTPGHHRHEISRALESLRAGGSTAGGPGLRMAYEVAEEHFETAGNTRILLATDGDFNLGMSSDEDLQAFVSEKRKSGVYLSVLGFGSGNYKDSKMETLADHGNGNYSYIDDILEGQRVLVGEFSGTLFTVAEDVKLQIEFNPAQVASYRLIGYDNRLLEARDFNDDAKDAGELGAGQQVTALYEIVPAGPPRSVDPLKYQDQGPKPHGELLTWKVRYQKPESQEGSVRLEAAVAPEDVFRAQPSANWRFASSVAECALLLKGSIHKEGAAFAAALDRAKGALTPDADGKRAEFVRLMEKASLLQTLWTPASSRHSSASNLEALFDPALRQNRFEVRSSTGATSDFGNAFAGIQLHVVQHGVRLTQNRWTNREASDTDTDQQLAERGLDQALAVNTDVLFHAAGQCDQLTHRAQHHRMHRAQALDHRLLVVATITGEQGFGQGVEANEAEIGNLQQLATEQGRGGCFEDHTQLHRVRNIEAFQAQFFTGVIASLTHLAQFLSVDHEGHGDAHIPTFTGA